jgi:hypothetical protein
MTSSEEWRVDYTDPLWQRPEATSASEEPSDG